LLLRPGFLTKQVPAALGRVLEVVGGKLQVRQFLPQEFCLDGRHKGKGTLSSRTIRGKGREASG